MIEIERELLKALVGLESAVASLSAAAVKPDLKACFSRIDELTRQLPRSTDPSLLHYLHKKSYQKARLHLQGSEAENQAGDCRHLD